jgi:hypothetical protein
VTTNAVPYVAKFRVEVLERAATGIYAVAFEGRPGLWTAGKLRKNNWCAATGEKLLKGEVHYRPIGNADYRMRRLARSYVEAER